VVAVALKVPIQLRHRAWEVLDVTRHQEGENRELKKAYKSPELTIYGAIVDLTQAVRSRGMLDGGTVLGRKHT
jgi:hypothetical protein